MNYLIMSLRRTRKKRNNFPPRYATKLFSFSSKLCEKKFLVCAPAWLSCRLAKNYQSEGDYPVPIDHFRLTSFRGDIKGPMGNFTNTCTLKSGTGAWKQIRFILTFSNSYYTWQRVNKETKKRMVEIICNMYYPVVDRHIFPGEREIRIFGRP